MDQKLYLAVLRGLEKQAAQEIQSQNILVRDAAKVELNRIRIILLGLTATKMARPYEI